MTIMKKTIICLLCLAAALNVRGADDDDRPVRIDQMPQTAQTFIARHFNGVKVALAKLAQRSVTEVIATQQAVFLAPMPARERKFLHQYLETEPQVKTYSHGREPYRSLVIAPK